MALEALHDYGIHVQMRNIGGMAARRNSQVLVLGVDVPMHLLCVISPSKKPQGAKAPFRICYMYERCVVCSRATDFFIFLHLARHTLLYFGGISRDAQVTRGAAKDKGTLM